MEEKVVEKIGNEIKEKKTLPQEVLGKIHKRIFENVLIANVILLFFIFISLGFMNIERDIFLTDLKVFSIGILAIAILVFENAYRKEEGRLAIYGLETLCLAIIVLACIFVCNLLADSFLLLVPIISYVFAIYYVAKSILLYGQMKKDYIKSLNDINEIVKEEKPIKKEETKKRKKVEEEEKRKEKKKEQDREVLENIEEVITKEKKNQKKTSERVKTESKKEPKKTSKKIK